MASCLFGWTSVKRAGQPVILSPHLLSKQVSVTPLTQNGSWTRWGKGRLITGILVYGCRVYCLLMWAQERMLLSWYTQTQLQLFVWLETLWAICNRSWQFSMFCVAHWQAWDNVIRRRTGTRIFPHLFSLSQSCNLLRAVCSKAWFALVSRSAQSITPVMCITNGHQPRW